MVVAKTGKVLQKKVLSKPAPKCSKKVKVGWENPPWKITHSIPTQAQINKYATAVSKQKVK